jgi:hypothetical protein
MTSSTLGRWAHKEHLLTVLPAETRHGARLPFSALVEAQLFWAFRQGGLSMKAVESGMKSVREELGSNMLKEGMLAHDGSDILMNLAKNSRAEEWVRARDLQTTIPKIVEEGLRLITWDEHHNPQ